MGTKNDFFSRGFKFFLDNNLRRLLLVLILVIAGTFHVNAQAILLDLENTQLSFLNSNRQVLVNTGNGGINQGSVHRYNNVVTKNGITVYGKLTIQEVNNAEITIFDDDVTFGIPARFQPRIGALSSSGGFIVYHLQFFDQATDQDVFLYNYYITGVDVDGNGSSNREFNEHSGFTSYTVNNPTQLVITTNSSTSRTRFLGRTTSLNGLNFDNSASYIMNYTNPNNIITFALGQTGQNDERHYSLNFGPRGGTFGNPITTTNPLPLAIDDIGTPLNSNTGGTAVANVLTNDLFNGVAVVPSQVDLSLVIPASIPGISLNTSTGAVVVSPGTPAGTYTLVYQICMNTNPVGRCDLATVTVQVREANLSITKTDSPDPIFAGQNLTYTITVANNGPTLATDVEVTDNLPAGLTFVSATPSVGTWSGNKWTIGTMANSATATLTLVAKVASSYSGSLSNTATVSSPTYDPVPGNNSATQTTNVNQSANLSIVKTDSPDPAVAGQNITYSITVTNLGPSDASTILVQDYLPAGLTIVSSSASEGTWNPPSWTIPTITAGSSVNLTLLSSTAPNMSGTINNTASIISSGTPDPDNSNNSSSQATVINTSADLSVVKTLTTNPLVAGELATYSITITNSGPSNAQTIQLADNVPTELDFVQFSVNGGTSWNSWTTPYEIASLPTGESVNILIHGSIKADIANGFMLSNSASIMASTPDPVSANNISNVTAPVTTRADMSITKTGPATISAGSKITYSLTVVNHGPSYAANISIADAVPVGITNAEYSLNGGNSWGVWNGTRNLPLFNYPGSNNILIRGDVAPGFIGNLVNIATVTSTTPDPNNADNQSSVTTAVAPLSDLIISKTQTVSPLVKNGPVNYVITVLNNGPSVATNLIVSDTINATIISGAEYFNGSSWVAWGSSIGVDTLLVDSTFTMQIRGTVTNNAADPVVNKASVSSSAIDPDISNNTVTINSSLNIEADLRVTKTAVASINAGDTITYQIVVENLSPNMNATNVIVTDNVDISKLTAAQYSVDNASAWASWTGSLNIGTLNFGTKDTLLIRAKVLSNVTGTIANTAVVSSSTSDPVPSNNSSSVSTTITLLADIAVEKIIITLPENIVAGSVIEYLLQYSNNGPSDATNYLITDTIPDGLFYADASRCQSAFIAWPGTFNAGTVVAGGACTIIIRGTIGSDYSGTLTNKASVLSNAPDPNIANNSSQISTAVNSNADLLVTMASMSSPVIAGDKIIYTVNVLNQGPSDALNVIAANINPAGVQNIEYSVDGVVWAAWTGNLSMGTIVSDTAHVFYIRGDVLATVSNGEILVHTVNAISDTNDPNLLNNTAVVNTTVQTDADLFMQKLVDVERPSAGDLVEFTLRVTNQGPSNASGVFVTDLLPSGVDFVSALGNGTYNNATGIWTIGSLAVAAFAEIVITTEVNSSGNYLNSAVATSADHDPDLSDNEAIVIIIPDIEAIYTVSPAQNVDSYLNSQALATVTDADGNINSSTITLGTLPSGTSMNPINGSVTVVNASLLVAGSYTFTVRTEDAIGGVTIQPVTIVIGPDAESQYVVSSPRNVDDYALGEVIASVSDADGDIVSLSIDAGTEPPGTVFNPVTGQFVVGNPAILVTGSYPLTISTVDETGGRTTQLVTIEIGPDIEAVYTVRPPKIIDVYQNGDTLATVSDLDGAILLFNLISSDPHPGIYFDPITGVITVSDASLLLSGTYRFRVGTEDVTGGESNPLVTIVINPDIESVYSVLPARNIDTYQNGNNLATVTDANGALISAVINSGTLPPGAAINPTTGVISVSNAAILVAGSYPLTITTVDIAGGSTTQNITIVINPDIESVYVPAIPENLFDYTNGEVIATVTDADGALVSALVTSGSLPPGTSINPVTGAITVTDNTLLEAGSFTFTVTTTDATGGITTQPVTLSFLAADLAITKTSNPSFIVSGRNLTYTITVTNYGPNEAINATVVDNIPSELTVSSITPSVGSWTAPEWTLGNLANGATATLTIVASLPANATGTLTNTATVSSLTSDPVPTNNSDTHEATINQFADLTVTVSDLSDPIMAGDTITYTLSVTNEGPSDANDLLLTDILPTGLLNAIYSSDGGSTWNSWSGTFSRSVLVAGGSFSILVKAATHPGTAHGHIVINPASVTSSTPDADLTNNSHSEQTTIERMADMSVVKTGPVSIVAGTKITWGLTVVNNGPSWANTVSIADAVPAGVTNAQYSLNNGNSWQNWGGTRNLPVFETDPGVNNILIRGDLDPGFTGSLTNTATVTTTTIDTVSTNNSSTAATTVLAEADLALTKQILTSPIGKNLPVTYQISVINLGPSHATGVLLSDVISPAQITGVEYSLNNGSSWLSWSGNVTIGTLKSDSTAVLLLRGTVANSASNPLVNTASVSSTVTDPVPGNNTQTISTPLEVEADISVVKTAATSVNAGDTITYTLTVTNHSPNMGATDVVLTDNVDPSKVENPVYSADNGLTWLAWTGTSNLGTIPHSVAKNILIKGKVLSNSTGSILNHALVSSGIPDPDQENNESEVTTSIIPVADISVTKELLTPVSEVIAGRQIEYLITYRNNGPSDATNFVITDDVPDELINVESSRCQTAFLPWQGSFNAGTVVAGGTCTILIRATVNSNSEGEITNTASVLSEVFDTNLLNNTAQVGAVIGTEADMAITKIADKEPVNAGENITYTIRIVNNGPSVAKDVTVTDVLQSGLTLVGATAVKGSWLSPVWSAGTFAPGESAELILAAKVDGGVLPGTVLNNTAIVNTSTTDPVVVNNSATEVTSVSSSSNVTITKVGTPDPVVAGENITYIITVANSGPSNARNVMVSDVLPSGVNFLSASGNGVYSSGMVAWSIPSLPAGGSVQYTLLVKTNPDLANGTIISNSAVAVPEGEDPIVSVPDEITVNAEANLSVIKFAEANVVFAGENIIYTIIVSNSGPSRAVSLVVTDQLPSDVTFVSASGNGTLNNGKITWMLNELLVDEQESFTLVVNVNSGVPVGTVIVNNAVADSETSDEVTSDPEEVTVEAASNFTITKSASNPTIFAGESVTYSIRVTNYGPSDAVNILITDTLSTDLIFESASDGGTFSNGVVKWNLPSLVNGENHVFTLTARVPGSIPSGTVIRNVVQMIPEGEDPIDGDPEDITIATRSNLSLIKSASVSHVNAGENITYMLHLTNSGPSSAQNITLSDVLPTGVTFVNATNGGSFAGGAVRWNLGTLANGAIYSVSFTVKVASTIEAGTVIRNVGTVQAGTNNPINSNPVDVIVDTDANISLFKTSEQLFVYAGENIVYRINVTNNGPSTARNIVVYDLIPTGTTFVTAFNNGLISTDRVIWNIQTLGVGETTVLTMTVKVNPDVVPGTLIRNVALSSSDDGDDPIESNPVDVPVLAKADLSVVKTGWPKPVNAGDIITYTINIKNNGPSYATGVTLKDVLPAYLTFVSINSNKGTWTDSILTIGTLANGESLVVTLKAKVDPGAPLGHEIVNTAIISSPVTDPDPANNSSTDRTLVSTTSDVSITKSGPAGIVAGTVINYRINVFNAGPSHAQSVVLNDIVTSPLSNVQYSLNDGISWQVWTGSLTVGTLNAGNVYSILLKGNVSPSATGSITNTASVGTTTNDPNPENNTDTEVTPLVIEANVSINKSGPANVIAGQQLLYTFTLSPGTSDATGVYITDIIPVGVSNAQYSINNGISWINWPSTNRISIGTLYAGAPVQLLLRGTVTPSATGTIMNTVLLETESFDPDITNNIDSVEVAVVPLADLTIDKTNGQEEYAPGTSVEYTVTVRNIGPSAVTGARVTDAAPSGTTITSWTATGTSGTVFTASGSGDIDQLVTLPIGGTIVYSVLVDVPANRQGALQNTAIVAVPANTIDPELENNTATDIDKPTTKAVLSIVKSASQQQVAAGENATYTIRVNNLGPNTAYNVVVTDTLPAGVAFVSASTGGMITNGIVKWTIASMANGASFAANLVVKVNNNVTAGTVIRNVAVAGSDNSDTLVVSIPIDITITNRSALAIEKTAALNTIIAGNDFSYSIKVTNNGPSDITNVAVRDTLPAGLQFVSATNGGTFSAGVVSWTINSLTNGSSATVSLVVKTGPQLTGGTIIRNVAVVQGRPGDDPVPSDPEDVTVKASATFSIVKEAPVTAVTGENLTYTIKTTNTSTIAATNVVVRDTLPTGLTFVSASEGGNADGNVVTWLLPSLNAVANHNFTVTALVNQSLTDGTLIRNVATITSENADTTYTSNRVTTTVTHVEPPQLIATDDNGTPLLGTVGGISVSNVLVNDHYGSTVVTIADVTITQVSSASQLISINTANGQVVVEEGTPAGEYELEYRICLIGNPQICDNATVTISVNAPSIIANDDAGKQIDNFIGGTAVANVTDNDLLNGEPFDISEVILTLVEPASISGIDLDVNTGRVTVQPGIPVGNYTLTYQICDVINPGNCDNAVVTFSITDDCDLLIPTGFSPNGDGINDLFKIRCIERYPDAKIEVYNRWGNVVFKKEKYGNIDVWGDTDAWWDGASTHNWNIGKDKLPPGTYIYILDLNKGDEKLRTGSIFLNR